MRTNMDVLVLGNQILRKQRPARAGRGLRLARALRARLSASAHDARARRRRWRDSDGSIVDLRELWAFMRVRKKWWLGPILVTMLLLSVADRAHAGLRGRAVHLRAVLGAAERAGAPVVARPTESVR